MVQLLNFYFICELHLLFPADRERDLVGTQLVRRNDEMACLNEKLKLQNTRMGCGEVHYNSRVKDIQVLAREVTYSGGGRGRSSNNGSNRTNDIRTTD